ncbi:MAG TPA: amidohydrolase family protein [Acidimicrobiales bacterium]|nr:amidohydrolase family protein [Acidimicrobiales bacterium]
MGALLVKGGTVVDGTGTPGRRADVRTVNGRITEVGPGLTPDGEQVIDASGCVVAPGFIDTHTHFDPTLFWDRTCDPMPQHGVTTVLVGNCSLSLAPVLPAQRETVTELFCYVEDLPEDVFAASVRFSWSSYDEYLATLDAPGASVNVATLVGHTPLRLAVMGDEAWERPAAPSEAARITALLEECLLAGAFGMSTSLGFDTDRAGRPVPSRVADDDEFRGLIAALAARGRFLQFIPTPGFTRLKQDVARLAALAHERDLPNTWIGVFDDAAAPERAPQLLDFAASLQQSGCRTYPQVSPRTLDIQVNWTGGMSFAALPGAWHPMVQAPPSEKRRMLADPAWRAVAREEWDRVSWVMIPHKHPERIRFVSVTDPSLSGWVGRTLADLVAARGGHLSDTLADWLLDNDLQPGVVGMGVGNSDPDGVAGTLLHPAAIIGNSDAGAHVRMMCAAGDTTLLLTRHVRERGDFALEAAVHALTGRQASLFGFEGRGVVAPGAHADLVVFDLDELRWSPDMMVDDLPGGASRLRRPPGGYRWTVVAGTVTQEGGQLTPHRPGHVLHR